VLVFGRTALDKDITLKGIKEPKKLFAVIAERRYGIVGFGKVLYWLY